MTLPDIFKDLGELDFTAEELELAQGTFNEEGIYEVMLQIASSHFAKGLASGFQPKILDVCAATGLAAWRLRALNPSEITLLDIDSKALEIAEKRFAGETMAIRPILVDATTWQADRENDFDLILLNSAYHHIPDERKLEFLNNLQKWVAPGGLILLGDHFLPDYTPGNLEKYRNSVTEFYQNLVEELIQSGTNVTAIRAIRKAGLMGWRQSGEYKVSWRFFREQSECLGFQTKAFCIWTHHRWKDTHVGTWIVKWEADDGHRK